MPTVLRNGRVLPNADEPPLPPSDTRARSNLPPRPSPYMLLIYPAVMALGSLFSFLSPIASPPATAFIPGITSDLNTPPSSTPPINYFAGKQNIINIYFVKIGWFWTTLAFTLLQVTTNPPSPTKRTHYIQSLLRYSLITLSWFLTTQWFFGPPLIDRSFTITGGHCEFPRSSTDTTLNSHMDLTTLTSALSCKAVGGRWRGGHDISGHIFMLVLSSAFLYYEKYISEAHSSHPNVSPDVAAKLAHDLTEEERKAMGGWESETAARARVWITRFVFVVRALDVWMILMTAIWFHTWLEKVSGLALAVAVLCAVYFLPEALPAWKTVVGGF